MLYDKRWDATIVDGIGERLRRAAEYLETYGWCQNQGIDENGRACLVGALTIGGADPLEMERAAVRISRFIGPPWNGNVVKWNDAPGRTKQEVIDVLRQAAAS